MPVSVERLAQCTGHPDCIYALAPSHEAGRFFTSGADGMVVGWDAASPETGEVLAKTGGTVYALCSLPASGQLVVGQNFDGIQVLSVAERKVQRSLKLGDSAIFDIQHYDGQLFVACGDGSIAIVDLTALSVLARVKHADKAARCIAIRPGGDEFAVGYSDNAVRIFGLPDGRLRHTLTGHTISVFAAAYSPDGRFLLTSGRDAHLKRWDAAKGYALTDDIIPHMYAVNAIVFHPDGRHFATCSKDKSIKIWEAGPLRLLKTIDRARHAGHGTSVNRLLWLDERTLVSASDDRMASIWAVKFDGA